MLSSQNDKWLRSQRRSVLWLFCLLLGFASICPLFAAKPNFTASLDRESVIVGETVLLTLKFEGISPKGMPSLPAIPGLQMVGGVSSSVNSSFSPEGMSSSTSYSVNLLTQRAGEFVIPALSVEIDGQKLQSQPIKLKVLQSDPNAPGQDLGDRLAFLSLSLPKKEMFVGEVLPVELRLYLRGDVLKISDPQIPPLRGDGFTASKFVQGERYTRRVGNNQFTIIPILTVLTPIKDGQLTLDALNGSVMVYRQAGGGRRQMNPFDIDSLMFGTPMEQQQIPLAIEQQTINVRALPAENVPAGFNGAVGNYTMTFNAGPTNVAVGDPITVKVQISGHGNLDALTIPEQPEWHDFKTYPPTSKVDTHDPLGVQGTKSFEQIIVPQNSDIKTLPALSFSYFDPDQKAYRLLTQPAVALMVRPSASAAPPTVALPNKTENAAPAQDIVDIKRQFGPLAQATTPLLVRPWFLALQGVPVVAWASLLLLRRRIDNLANNPKLRRRLRVTQITRQGLNDLRTHAAANDSDQFFATLSHLLQEQLGERLDLPASAITEAAIEENLVPLGVPETTLAPLRELFQTCNLARYAPIKSSQELAAIIPKVESVLLSLQEVKP